MFENLYAEALELQEWQVGLRRHFHANPEIGLETHATSARIQKELKDLGVECVDGWCKSSDGQGGAGVTADLGNGNGPVILLRADMDALPINEETDLPYKSKVSGRMHACGHDSHTAVLLGVAKLLKAHETKIKGKVRLMFQPGEEMAGGCRHMVDEGVLLVAKTKVSRAYSMHVMPFLDAGVFMAPKGVLLAGGTHFTITVNGRGGHAGLPAVCRDPVIATAHLISMAQMLSSRETMGYGTTKQGLISFCELKSVGTSANAIPDSVRVTGTVRSGDEHIVGMMKTRLTDICVSMKTSHQVEVTCEFGPTYPSLLNDSDAVDVCEPLIKQASVLPAPSRSPNDLMYFMEDFGIISHEVPSVTISMGCNGPCAPRPNSLHNSKFSLEESYMPRASALFAAIALQETS